MKKYGSLLLFMVILVSLIAISAQAQESGDIEEDEFTQALTIIEMEYNTLKEQHQALEIEYNKLLECYADLYRRHCECQGRKYIDGYCY